MSKKQQDTKAVDTVVVKKTLLLVLESLIPYWQPALGLQFLLQETDDEQIVFMTRELVSRGIKTIKNTQQKEYIRERMRQMYVQKKEEESLHVQEAQEAENLLDSLFTETA